MLSPRREVIRLCVADRRIETPLAMACVEHIPDPDAMRKHANRSLVIGQFVQRRLTDNRIQQPPRLIDALVNLTSAARSFVPQLGSALAARRLNRRAAKSSLFASSYAPFAVACSSRAYCVGGRPTCRVNATLKVLAEL